jgi:hypothetical protein
VGSFTDGLGSKRSLKYVLRFLKKQFNADTEKLMDEVKDLIVKTVLVG